MKSQPSEYTKQFFYLTNIQSFIVSSIRIFSYLLTIKITKLNLNTLVVLLDN